MTHRTHPSRLQEQVVGLVATGCALTFILGVPALLVLVSSLTSIQAFEWSALRAADTGTLFLTVVFLAAWIGWAIFTYLMVHEATARVRGVPPRRIPGLTGPQGAAGQLVALAALLFIATPVVTMATTPHATTIATLPPTQPAADVLAPLTVPAHPATAEPVHREEAPSVLTEEYVTPRWGSFWQIAKDRLGDGRRYHELRALNPDAVSLQDEAGFLPPGTKIRLPIPHTEIVHPGDTLSQIAEDTLGNADDYMAIFNASTHIRQPDGQHLTDPNLIRPSWHLDIPQRARQPEKQHPPERVQAADPRVVQRQIPDRDLTPPPSIQTPPVMTPNTPQPQVHHQASDASHGEVAPAWLMPGLAGAGAAVAGAAWLVLRGQRRTQLRQRVPGGQITPPPPDLVPVEKNLHAAGTFYGPRLEALDRLLRELAGDAPQVGSVRLRAEAVSLRLTSPARPAGGWTGTNDEWTTTLPIPSEEVDPLTGASAPYPLLVSVGVDADGNLVFLNLEELGCIALGGDPSQALALARHIGAELALNPWSTLAEVTTIGIGSELATLAPGRLRQHAEGDQRAIDRFIAHLDTDPTDPDPDAFHALVATRQAAGLEGALEAISAHAGPDGRSAAAVVTIGDTLGPNHRHQLLTLTNDGRLQAPDLNLDVVAAGLTTDEAQACARLVDVLHKADVLPIPANENSPTGSDLAGALPADLTETRPQAGQAGERSLLPGSAEVYADSALTIQDLAALAPPATEDAKEAACDADPSLDEDLARWQAPVPLAPKLTLLGPVTARTTGDAQQIARRKPFYIELLAYLALHPHGVTALEVADAFSLQPERARRDLSVLRHWLGDAPTGSPYLPSARNHQTNDETGTAAYQLHGVLSDLDLFQRLRTRGQAQGADGIEDLISALHLITGEPFTGLRPAGWTWLLDGDRIDHIATCGIVDVALIVTAHATANDDLDLAHFAAETGYQAAPYDEAAQLNMINVLALGGHHEAAHRQLIDDVFNRDDEGLGPIDPPPRTTQITQAMPWASPTNRRSTS